MSQSPSRRHKHQKNSCEETLEVVCRIKDSDEPNPCVVAEDNNHVCLIPPANYGRNGELMQRRIYRFGHVFDYSDSQSVVFKRCCMDLLEELVQGRNALLFAYGVTGGGKTYTMAGDTVNVGILPRAADVLFNSIPELASRCVFYPDGRNGFRIRSEAEASIEQHKCPPPKFELKKRARESKHIKFFPTDMVAAVFVSYVEIYNDLCYDLLDDSLTSASRTNMSKNLRSMSNGQVFVDQVTEVEVQTSDEILIQYMEAQERRKKAETLLNANSSRSHTIFNIRLAMCNKNYFAEEGHSAYNEEPKVIVSQLSIVDLAGSERAKRTNNVGDRLAEAGKINQSLSALRKCFEQMRENQRRGATAINVSYRDYKLTHLFKNFFEGGGKVRMIVCLNPRSLDYDENMIVMKFAEWAQTLDLKTEEGPLLPLGDIANLPYGRRDVKSWFAEVTPIVNCGTNLQLQLFPKAPPIPKLIGPNDVETIRNLREYYEERRAKHMGYRNTTLSNATIFEQNLLMKLCDADLSRHKIVKLEVEMEELTEANESLISQKRQIERELNACKKRMMEYEGKENKVRRLEDDERARQKKSKAAWNQQQQALMKAAEVLEFPISTASHVATMCKKFTAETENATNGSADPYARSKTLHRQTHRNRNPSPNIAAGDGVGTTVGAYGTGRVGYMNPRFHRRSRSAGSRVLNHEPMNKIPTGTLFQPKYPKNTKHTTQLGISDLGKCDEYVTTNQSVDVDGNVITDLVKGSIVPTAGGGSAVMFRDVESLRQQDSPSSATNMSAPNFANTKSGNFKELDEQLRKTLEVEARREEERRRQAEAEYQRLRQKSAEQKQAKAHIEEKHKKLRAEFMKKFDDFLEDEVDMAFGVLKNKDSNKSALNLMHQRFAIDLLEKMNVGIPSIRDHIYEATKLEIPFDPSLRNKYTTVKKIGSGSFGDAELAREDILDGTGKRLMSYYAVVKNVPRRQTKFQVNPNHIINEVRALRALKYMNSVFTTKMLFAYQDNDYVHIAMEYVECGDLEHIMLHKVRQRITPDFENKVRYVAASLLIALLEIHRAGILHNDLFPANMLMDKQGRIKVSDFGLSRAKDSLPHKGAMAVMPPENTKTKSPTYTTISEYWSLGVSLYRLAMGAYYFGVTYTDVLKKQSEFHDVVGIGNVENNLTTNGMTKAGANFISYLFHPEPASRAVFVAKIARHEWFKDFDFRALNNGTMVSPFYNFAKNCGIPDDASEHSDSE